MGRICSRLACCIKGSQHTDTFNKLQLVKHNHFIFQKKYFLTKIMDFSEFKDQVWIITGLYREIQLYFLNKKMNIKNKNNQ